jgi:hypothetical protein
MRFHSETKGPVRFHSGRTWPVRFHYETKGPVRFHSGSTWSVRFHSHSKGSVRFRFQINGLRTATIESYSSYSYVFRKMFKKVQILRDIE